MNIAEILKNAPEGTKLYSPIFGEGIYMKSKPQTPYSIKVVRNSIDGHSSEWFTEEGKYFDSEEAECMLFPSKEQRDWTKFKIDLPINTPVIVLESLHSINSTIRLYAGNNRYYSRNKESYYSASYIIPFDKIKIENGKFIFNMKDNYGSCNS